VRKLRVGPYSNNELVLQGQPLVAELLVIVALILLVGWSRLRCTG